MKKITAIFISMIFANYLLAGPIWQAMELFESGQMAESAIKFGPYCKSSPVAYYYCKYLAELGHLPKPVVDALVDVEHPTTRMANEAFSASIAYRKIIESTGTNQKAALNHLIDLAEKPLFGTAFYLLAKLPDDPSIKKLINKARKNTRAHDFIKPSTSQKTALYLLAADNLEFRSIAELMKTHPTFKVKERKIEDYQEIFKRKNKPEFEIFEKINSQMMTKFGHDLAKHTIYGSANFIELGALFGSLYLQNYLGNAKSNCQDYKSAIYWFSWAAESDDPRALADLSHHYSKGEYIEKNLALAFKYASKGAPLLADAKVNLGVFYENGQGTQKDPLKAASLFIEVYESDKEAYQYCAKYAGNAFKAAQSYENAQKWYQVAYEKHGDLDAGLFLGKMQLKRGDKEKGWALLDKLSNQPDLAKSVAYIIAKYLLDCVIEARDPGLLIHKTQIKRLFEEQIRLNQIPSYLLFAQGMLYRIGLFFDKDLEMSKNNLNKSAKLGEPRAWIELGYIEEEHNRDFAKAAEYYRQAFDAGYTYIANNLGHCLKELRNDDVEVVSLFRLALDNGNSLAAFNLAQMHIKKRGGLTADGHEIIRLLQIALTDVKDADCALQIGDIYLNGMYGITQSLSLAKDYYKKAADLGNPYGHMMTIATKFMEEGKISYDSIRKHGRELAHKLATTQEPNDVLNFMIRLRDGAAEIRRDAADTGHQAKYLRIKSNLDALNGKKEVRIEDFTALAQEVLELAPDSSMKSTKKGFIFASGKNRFSAHRPHKNGPHISGKALSKGVDFLRGSLEQKSDGKD